MEKRGSGHVEIVLAMVLFVSVILFIISVFDFQKNPLSSDSVLPYVLSSFEKYNSVDMRVYSIVLSEKEINAISSKPTIITIKLPEKISLEDGIRVENYDGMPLQYYRDVSDNFLIHVEFQDNYFFFVILSVDITSEEETMKTGALNENLYKISSTQDYIILSEKKIKKTKENYDLNYDLLREELQISNKINFGFSINFGEGDFINTDRAVSIRKEVGSKFSRAQILREDGKREFADFGVQTW